MSKKSELNKTIQAVRKHSRQLVREWDVVNGVYLDTDYTLTQCHIMFELSTNPSLTLMALTEKLLLDKSNASRTVKNLIKLGLVTSEKGTTDGRTKFFSLTPAGKKALQSTISLADEQVGMAMLNLSPEQRETVIDGLRLYSSALGKGRLQSRFTIRPIKKRDNSQMAKVIRTVMTEFGAVGEGYSIEDKEVDDMFGNYNDERSFYYVVVDEDNSVLGGAGIGPLKGGKKTTCELRKMFYLPSLRGLGLGNRMLLTLLEQAKSRGYKQCYLESLERMDQAISLYERNGFKKLEATMGKTGHCSCDCFYARDL